MLLHSLEFALFLPVVFLIYWLVFKNDLNKQNLFLLCASYFFYGWWDWRFIILLLTISLFNYFTGTEIGKNKPGKRKKFWLITGLIINIGILCVFKYFNFFIEGFIDIFLVFGYKLPESSTKIVLPLGISFYIFLCLSYILDIYKNNLRPHKNVFEVLLTFSFFPIILAGPIQRPASLLPQITKNREFSYYQAANGLKQILWGLFTKVVIADNLIQFVDEFFSHYNHYSGSTLALGAVFFTIQIYADFSGYSNMAIGVAKLFGFNLMQNFAYPYFSRDISEFWRRWHISLTTWFRDYLFLPISFSISWRLKAEKVFFIKTDNFIYIIASTITWILTGLWHGANYTFIIWGMINGFLLIFYHLQRNARKNLFKRLGINNKNSGIVMVETFINMFLIINLWVFFRAETVKDAFLYLQGIYSKSLLTIPEFQGKKTALIALIHIFIFIIIEWLGREQKFAIAQLGQTWLRPLRWAFYSFLIFLIGMFMHTYETPFIYLKF